MPLLYTKPVATETDDNCMRVKIVLDKFEIKILETLVQLDEYMKPGLLEIDKKLKSHDQTHDTQIGGWYARYIFDSCLQERIYKDTQLLIDNEGDINQVYGMLETPLTSACSYGNDEILQFPISKGYIVNQVDGMGHTPLTAACRRQHEKTVQLLIDKGSNVNQITDMRETPMTESCRGGNEKIVQLLIDKEGGVNQVDGLRETL
ncbi:unnamed protein product [Mytilus edulis]|uniref:Uncharacterized protein n=1 Tax=Mytilus edulis TaxID=6550 RepID=A0A8S3QDB6_MYTED|nr:unnamed protein product [Mytilus edulis]